MSAQLSVAVTTESYIAASKPQSKNEKTEPKPGFLSKRRQPY